MTMQSWDCYINKNMIRNRKNQAACLSIIYFPMSLLYDNADGQMLGGSWDEGVEVASMILKSNFPVNKLDKDTVYT